MEDAKGMAQKIPATVITGFLGAGKTSIIRHLLENANGRRIALIINEFGDVGIDGEILRGCGIEGCEEGDILELANGCICCTVADDFVPTMEALLDRERTPDQIVIETSGLAMPKPLVKAFNWPDIRTRVTVDAVVTVVDGPAVADGLFATDPQAVQAQREADDALEHESPLEELFKEQLGCADLVVINKSDLLGGETLDEVKAEVAGQLRPSVKVVTAAHGAVDPKVLLGLGAAAGERPRCAAVPPRRHRRPRPRRFRHLQPGGDGLARRRRAARTPALGHRRARRPAGEGLRTHARAGHAVADSGGGRADSALLRPRLARVRASMHAAGGDWPQGPG